MDIVIPSATSIGLFALAATLLLLFTLATADPRLVASLFVVLGVAVAISFL